MLLAMNEYNKCCFAKHAEKGKKYYCRGCRKRVILKKGKKKCAHFAHQKSDNCSVFSERESKEHLQLKECFMDWLGQSVEPVFLEAYLPRLRQRPDILLANLAIEIQCSRLSHQRFIERTQNYLNNSYQVWWILGNFLGQSQFSLIEKVAATIIEKEECIAGKLISRNKSFICIIILQRLYQGIFPFAVAAGLFLVGTLKKYSLVTKLK